jgi:hypothetical protein
MLARENCLFGCPRSKPSQSSVPAGLTLASDFGFCVQCQAGASLVLRRPIEITALTGLVDYFGGVTRETIGKESSRPTSPTYRDVPLSVRGFQESILRTPSVARDAEG